MCVKIVLTTSKVDYNNLMKIILIIITILNLSSFAKQPPIKIATHYSPPWSNGDCTGAEIDIIKAAFKIESIEIECVYYSYGRLVKYFKSGHSEFSTPITRVDGDSVHAYYSDSFHKYSDVVLSYSDKKITLNDFKGKRILAYQGASEYLGEDYRAATKMARSYVESSDREGQIELLQKKRVDYIIGEVNLLMFLAKKSNVPTKVYANLVLKKWDIRSASHKEELMKKFNSGLKKLKENGTVDKIYQQYHIIK